MLPMRGLHIGWLHMNLLLMCMHFLPTDVICIFDDIQWDALYLCMHCVAAFERRGAGQPSGVAVPGQ